MSALGSFTDDGLPRTYSRFEVAPVLNLSPVTIADMARAKRIPSVKVGHERRFTAKQIQQYLDANSTPMIPTGQTQKSRNHHKKKAGV